MLIASCHCGAVRIEVPRPPAYLNECHCSVCRRYGVQWGYYRPDEVRMLCEPGTTESYSWGERSLEFHRCRVCGCVSHWRPTDDSVQRMAINGRLLDVADLVGVPVRQSDGPPD